MKNFKLRCGLIPSLLVMSLVTGCGHQEKCTLDYEHAHEYINDEGLRTYRISERDQIEKYQKTDTTIPLTEELLAIDKYCLARISDNLERLEAVRLANPDYKEYRWENGFGEVSYFTEPNEFTSENNYRMNHTMYKACRIGKDLKGKTKIYYSEPVDNLEDIMDEYPFFNIYDYKTTVYTEDTAKTFHK